LFAHRHFPFGKDKIVIKKYKDQQQVKRKLILVSRILWDSLSLKEAFLCQRPMIQEPRDHYNDNFDIEIDEDKSNYKFHKKS
jgi:hypothetical protein